MNYFILSQVAPINSADDLAQQTEIRYGALAGGSTVAFFKNSKIRRVSTIRKLLKYMWATKVVINHV